MDASLFLPVAMLAAVLVMAPVVLRLDRRSRQLELRVEHAAGLRRSDDPGLNAARSIRLPQARQSSAGSLAYKLFRMPADLPLAHVIPSWAVFVLGIAGGLADGAFASIFLSPPVAAVTGIVLCYMVIRGTFGWEFRRYQARLIRQLPDTIELVVSATRAGLPVAEAFRAVYREMPEPTREEFKRVCNEMGLGVAADEALMNVQRRTLVTEYAIFAVTVAVQTRSGGRIAEAVQNLAEIVRQRLTIAMRGEALAAEAKLSARIMSVLPFVGGGIMSFMHPGYLTPLFTDPRGKQMFVIGIGTLLTGMYAMRRLVKSVSKE